MQWQPAFSHSVLAWSEDPEMKAHLFDLAWFPNLLSVNIKYKGAATLNLQFICIIYSLYRYLLLY